MSSRRAGAAFRRPRGAFPPAHLHGTLGKPKDATAAKGFAGSMKK